MENKSFPNQEPGDFPILSEFPEVIPETPVPEEFFGPDDAVIAEETAPVENEAVADTAEELSSEPVTVEADSYSSIPAPVDAESVDALPVPEDMEASPIEDMPKQDRFTAPLLREEITPDEHAMAWHGMTHPSEAEPEFDLSILEHPDLNVEESLELPEEKPDYLLEAEALLQEKPREPDYQEYSDDPEAFQEVFQASSTEETKASHDRPVRKGRPKRKKGEILFGLPHILVTIVWLAIIVSIGVTLGRMLWICAADVLAFGREDKAVTITIYETDAIDDIADKLHKNELIRYPGLFKLYASFAVDEGEIDPGIWDLNTRYDYHALVNMMSVGSTRSVVEDLLIPEGYTCQQIFDLLEKNKVCTAQDLSAYAASGELSDYWFLEGVERGSENCLEGFLFPDTYDFYKNSSPREVLDKLLGNFEYRFNEEMRAQLDTLNANVAGGTFDIHDVIIVASMIEKETANNEESPKIASVIYNRLFNWDGTPAYLNIDASIIYALNGKTDLTSEDMRVDSPYNTYLYVGLTPGPISNPGLASIKAALNPAKTDFYYYVLNPAVGTHQFSKTLEEHEGYVAQFNAE